jgi:ketosteroid isomerase-like protein
MKRRIGAVVLILLAAACGYQAAPQPAGGPAGAGAAAQIAAEEDAWSREYAARDLERLVDHYAPDATLKEPGAPPLTGRWIRVSLEQSVNDPAFALTFGHDRIEVARSGDLAYSRGHYRITYTDRRTGQPTTDYGTYLTVWQRQVGGRWKVLEDFITPGPRPSQPM